MREESDGEYLRSQSQRRRVRYGGREVCSMLRTLSASRVQRTDYDSRQKATRLPLSGNTSARIS